MAELAICGAVFLQDMLNLNFGLEVIIHNLLTDFVQWKTKRNSNLVI